MLLLKQVKKTDSEVVYNYFPEKGKHFGSVTLDRMTGEVVNAEIADNDLHRRYLHHAISRIIEYIQNDTYESEAIVAWY